MADTMDIRATSYRSEDALETTSSPSSDLKIPPATMTTPENDDAPVAEVAPPSEESQAVDETSGSGAGAPAAAAAAVAASAAAPKPSDAASVVDTDAADSASASPGATATSPSAETAAVALTAPPSASSASPMECPEENSGEPEKNPSAAPDAADAAVVAAVAAAAVAAAAADDEDETPAAIEAMAAAAIKAAAAAAAEAGGGGAGKEGGDAVTAASAEQPRKKRTRRGGWDTPSAETVSKGWGDAPKPAAAAPAVPMNPLQVREELGLGERGGVHVWPPLAGWLAAYLLRLLACFLLALFACLLACFDTPGRTFVYRGVTLLLLVIHCLDHRCHF